MSQSASTPTFRGRRLFMMAALGCGFAALTVRAVDLQVLSQDFL